MVCATSTAVAMVLSTGTTRLTRPIRSASAALMFRPVSTISCAAPADEERKEKKRKEMGEGKTMALDLPMARVRRWVPPMPGMVPTLTSGCPN